jgi:hypothetical protein
VTNYHLVIAGCETIKLEGVFYHVAGQTPMANDPDAAQKQQPAVMVVTRSKESAQSSSSDPRLSPVLHIAAHTHRNSVSPSHPHTTNHYRQANGV